MLPSSKLRMQRIWDCSIHPAKKCPWARVFSAPYGLLGWVGPRQVWKPFRDANTSYFHDLIFKCCGLGQQRIKERGGMMLENSYFITPPPPAPRMWRWAGMCEEKLRKQTGDNTGMWLVHPALNYRLKGKTPTAPSLLALIARALFLPFNISFLSQC